MAIAPLLCFKCQAIRDMFMHLVVAWPVEPWRQIFNIVTLNLASASKVRNLFELRLQMIAGANWKRRFRNTALCMVRMQAMVMNTNFHKAVAAIEAISSYPVSQSCMMTEGSARGASPRFTKRAT